MAFCKTWKTTLFFFKAPFFRRKKLAKIFFITSIPMAVPVCRETSRKRRRGDDSDEDDVIDPELLDDHSSSEEGEGQYYKRFKVNDFCKTFFFVKSTILKVGVVKSIRNHDTLDKNYIS
jgi:hypothetical protein